VHVQTGVTYMQAMGPNYMVTTRALTSSDLLVSDRRYRNTGAGFGQQQGLLRGCCATKHQLVMSYPP
jgi:hypothetical protein